MQGKFQKANSYTHTANVCPHGECLVWFVCNWLFETSGAAWCGVTGKYIHSSPPKIKTANISTLTKAVVNYLSITEPRNQISNGRSPNRHTALMKMILIHCHVLACRVLLLLRPCLLEHWLFLGGSGPPSICEGGQWSVWWWRSPKEDATPGGGNKCWIRLGCNEVTLKSSFVVFPNRWKRLSNHDTSRVRRGLCLHHF